MNASTRQKRGKGIRKRVAPSTVMPKNWKDFLRCDENKTDLFAFLSRRVVHLPLAEGKELYATDGSGVLCSPVESYLACLAPCSQEEANTRLLLHVADAVQKGCKKVTIRTVDTDVVVLAVASFSKIAPDELWVAFGVGSSFHYIAVHEIVATMNPTKCLTLPVLHAFTGCDTVSAFAGRGKKTAWETWKSFPETVAVRRWLVWEQEKLLKGQLQKQETLLHRLQLPNQPGKEDKARPDHCLDTEYTDCSELFSSGCESSGFYSIKPHGSPFPFRVYCDMSDGGGWTVIQRRINGTESFNRSWAEYKDGFGDKDAEFWLGNDNLHYITTQGNYSLRINLGDFDGSQRYAEYKNFQVANEKDHYRLAFGSYVGTAGDALSGSYQVGASEWASHQGIKFSTHDKDNDNYKGNCAQEDNGAGGSTSVTQPILMECTTPTGTT
ncbi:Fibrinogen-like protein 1, partial [Dissostichus eleginoides]